MGGPNPDRIPIGRRRHQVATVGQMYEEGWKLRAQCLTCLLELEVDVRPIIALKGPSFVLWDKLSRCRKVGCRGRVRFLGHAPGMNGYSPLVTPRPRPEPDPIPGQVRTLGR